METIKKTTIHRLTPDFVEINSEQYATVGGKEVKLDMPKHATSYVNSVGGRNRLQQEQPENIVTAVLAIWGEVPTVEETAAKLPFGKQSETTEEP